MRYIALVPLVVFLGLTSVSRGEVRNKSSRRTHAKAAPTTHYDLAAVNNPATADPLNEKSEGSAVLRAQVLLSRAKFSVGEIDGHMGTNALQAVEGFRAAHWFP